MKIVKCISVWCYHVLNVFIDPTDTSEENEHIQLVVSQLEESDAEKGIESELDKDKMIFLYAYT